MWVHKSSNGQKTRSENSMFLLPEVFICLRFVTEMKNCILQEIYFILNIKYVNCHLTIFEYFKVRKVPFNRNKLVENFTVFIK